MMAPVEAFQKAWSDADQPDPAHHCDGVSACAGDFLDGVNRGIGNFLPSRAMAFACWGGRVDPLCAPYSHPSDLWSTEISANPLLSSGMADLHMAQNIYGGDYWAAGKVVGDNLVTAAITLATLAAGPIAGQLASAIRAGDEVVDAAAVTDSVRLPGCSFTAVTTVAMANGSKMAISSLKVGDRVLAYDPKTGVTGAHTVLAVMAHKDPAVEHLATSVGSIDTTPNHPFFTIDRGWIEAGSLKAGEKVRTATGASAYVLGFSISDSPTTMWDITVEGAHSFFVGAGRVLVHNFCGWDGSEPANTTGRWMPYTPEEKSLLDQVFDNPTQGKQLLQPRDFTEEPWQGWNWVKYSKQLGSSVIHWNFNVVTGQIDDWKFVTGN